MAERQLESLRLRVAEMKADTAEETGEIVVTEETDRPEKRSGIVTRIRVQTAGR